MRPEFPLTRDLVLIGGGHTHALVLRRWGMRPLAGARVTVINPGPTAPYSGMLPGFVAGHYSRDELDIDLVQLARFAGARLIDGAVSAIDPIARQITVPGRPPIGYDIASIDVGITSAMPDLPGFAAHGVPAKPLGVFASRWDAFRSAEAAPDIAVVGGGVAGAELALAMKFARPDATLHLIDRGRVLDALGHVARQKMLAALDAAGVTVIADAAVAEVTADAVLLEDGRSIPSQFTTGAAGAKPHDWITGIGVKVKDGFVAVDANLQSSDPALFAVGDCAHLTASPRPKAGVFAVREAPVLFDNLRAALSGGALRPYHPQRDYLKLISLGEKSALAEKFGTARAGPLLWRWKDHIDVKFMRQFTDLAPMTPPAPPLTHALGLTEALGAKPMCGGCGAKVGRGALLDVVGLGDDAGVITTGGAQQVLSTDHLRSFWADPVVMTRIAAVHALGDVWAMGAKPQAATLNLILPRMSDDLQRRTLAEISAAAQEVVAEAGGQIVGGHTSLGAEMTIGLSVTGLCENPPKTLGGAQVGDVLILSKPIGSGVIMAAEMQGIAAGHHVIGALRQMQQGQAAAATLLLDATAMTDVTGFGLAGHLNGICAASGVGVQLVLDEIPMLDGAVELSERGVRSSLYADNLAGAGVVTGVGGARFDLLFDPQTAGGLLASLPAAKSGAALSGLQNAGYAAAIIGEVTDGPAAITVR